MLRPSITTQFQALFTSFLGILFSIPSRYYYAIGLDMYLELGVDASHIHRQYPMPATLELQNII